jgi:MYXO-CTERM domain-containing protein
MALDRSDSYEKGEGMRLMPMVVSCAFVVMVASNAQAEVISYWHFNGFNPANGPVVAASTGSGVLDCTSFGTGLTSFGGTDVNALEGVVAGDSLGLTGSSHNGSFAEIGLSTAGYADLSLSFAARRSSTGFGNDRLEALIGEVWTLVASFNPSTVAWTTHTFDLSELDVLENGFAKLRFVFDGASSGSGTVRFDNLTVSGSTVPAPGALALLAAAGALGRRRRG